MRQGASRHRATRVVCGRCNGDNTTALVNNKECAFVSFDQNGIAKCSIEQAYNDDKIEFKKPISCHLFPIRVKSYRDFEAINYESLIFVSLHVNVDINYRSQFTFF